MPSRCCLLVPFFFAVTCKLLTRNFCIQPTNWANKRFPTATKTDISKLVLFYCWTHLLFAFCFCHFYGQETWSDKFLLQSMNFSSNKFNSELGAKSNLQECPKQRFRFQWHLANDKYLSLVHFLTFPETSENIDCEKSHFCILKSFWVGMGVVGAPPPPPLPPSLLLDLIPVCFEDDCRLWKGFGVNEIITPYKQSEVKLFCQFNDSKQRSVLKAFWATTNHNTFSTISPRQTEGTCGFL